VVFPCILCFEFKLAGAPTTSIVLLVVPAPSIYHGGAHNQRQRIHLYCWIHIQDKCMVDNCTDQKSTWLPHSLNFEVWTSTTKGGHVKTQVWQPVCWALRWSNQADAPGMAIAQRNIVLTEEVIWQLCQALQQVPFKIIPLPLPNQSTGYAHRTCGRAAWGSNPKLTILVCFSRQPPIWD
jgi:hypothetical protein